MGFKEFFAKILVGQPYKPTAGYIGPHEPIRTDDGVYLTVTAKKLYLPYLRRFSGTFYAALYGRVHMQLRDGKTHTYQAIDPVSTLKKDEFSKLDSSNLGKIILSGISVLSDVPYYNTAIDLCVSLFAVKSSDLALPYVTLLKDIANAAGVSFISKITPFADILEDSVLNLASKDTLEIGESNDSFLPENGVYVLVGSKEERFPLEQLTYDAQGNCLLCNGVELEDHPYVVLEFKASDRCENWRHIPEIEAAFGELRDQLNRTPDNPDVNQAAFQKFSRIVDMAPELLSKNTDQLVGEVRKEIKKYLAHKPKETKVPVRAKVMLKGAAYGGGFRSAPATVRTGNPPFTLTLDDIQLFKAPDPARRP